MAERLVGAQMPCSFCQVEALYVALFEDDLPDDSVFIIAAGLAFGSLFVDGGGFEWLRISDEYGEETVVALIGKQIWVAPISMIHKRLARRERLDMAKLKQDAVKAIQGHADAGNCADR